MLNCQIDKFNELLGNEINSTSLGGNIVTRTTLSKKSEFKNGATVLDLMMGQTPTTTTKSFFSSKSIETGRDRTQIAKVPYFFNNANNVILGLVPSTRNISCSLLGTQYDFVHPYNSYNKSSFCFPSGTSVGIHHFGLGGGGKTLGDFLIENQDVLTGSMASNSARGESGLNPITQLGNDGIIPSILIRLLSVAKKAKDVPNSTGNSVYSIVHPFIMKVLDSFNGNSSLSLLIIPIITAAELESNLPNSTSHTTAHLINNMLQEIINDNHNDMSILVIFPVIKSLISKEANSESATSDTVVNELLSINETIARTYNNNEDLSLLFTELDTVALNASGGSANDVVTEMNNFITLNTQTAGYGNPFVDDSLTYVLSHLYIKNKVTVSPPTNCCPMTIIIKRGVKWFGNHAVKCKCSNEFLSTNSANNNMRGIVSDGVFIEDFTLNFDTYQIVDTLQLSHSNDENFSNPIVIIPHNNTFTGNIMLSTSLGIFNGSGPTGDFVNDFKNGAISINLQSGTGFGWSTMNLPDDDSNYHPTNISNRTDRNLKAWIQPIILSNGFTIPEDVSFDSFWSIPPSFTFPEKTEFSSIEPQYGSFDPTLPRRKFSSTNTVLHPGFIIFSDVISRGVIVSNDQLLVQPNSMVDYPQHLHATSTWSGNLNFETSLVESGFQLTGYMEFLSDYSLPTSVTLEYGSVLVPGTILPEGSETKAGMISNTNVTFDYGLNIESDLNILNSIKIKDGVTLNEGSIIRARSNQTCPHFVTTKIPRGMIITNENILPFDKYTINVTDGITFKYGMEIENAKVGPNFKFPSGTCLPTAFCLPEGSFLSSSVHLPPGTQIYKNSIFDFPFPLPEDMFLWKGTKLYKGTVFGSGAPIPRFQARQQECKYEENWNNIPYLTTVINDKQYIVYPPNTIFGPGFTLPKGSVLLNTTNFCSTFDSINPVEFSKEARNCNCWVVNKCVYKCIEEGYFKYSGQHHSLSGQDFKIISGIPTQNTILPRAEISFTHSIVVPFVDGPHVFDGISFSVNFILKRDIILDSDYKIIQNNLVFWAEDREIPFSFVINGDTLIPECGTHTNKPICFPQDPCNYICDILSESNSFIKMPCTITEIPGKIKIGCNGLFIDNSCSESWIEISKGTLINVKSLHNSKIYNGLYVNQDTEINNDWEIVKNIYNVPPFIAGGLYLPSGSSLPGDVVIPAGFQFPKGLTTTTPIELSSNFTIGTNINDYTSYTLPAGTLVGSGSTFSQGSIFNGGALLNSINLGPVNRFDGGKFVIFQKQRINTTILYNYFFGESELSVTPIM